MRHVGTTDEVVHAFVDGEAMRTRAARVPGGCRVDATGDTLYSYRTQIAYRAGDVFLVSPRKYSPTTSQHQNALRWALRHAGFEPTDKVVTCAANVPGRWGGFGPAWHATGVENLPFVVWERPAPMECVIL